MDKQWKLVKVAEVACSTYTRGHTISLNFVNSLRIHMVFLNTYFDLEVGTESPHELTKSLRIWFS